MQDFDLIVTHGCFSFAPEAAAVAARRAGVPYLVVPHGMLAEWALTRRRKQVHLRLRTRTLVRAARGFICTSAREEQEVARLVGHAPPTLRVNWGIPADVLAAAPADGDRWRERHGLPTGRKMVLFLGRLHPKKGIHDQLLPAMAHARGDWLLVIAGPEDAHTPRYVDVVRRTVQEGGLADRVFFTGPLDSREKLDALDACDVFVLPSHSENFGVTVAEAMARARPVIVSEAVQIADAVAAAGAGVVVPLDPPRLADALSRVLSDPGLAQSMGASGRSFVARELSWETAGRRVCDFYRRVLHDRAAG